MRSIKRKLDIILTHCDEPWEVFEKFFVMLGLQRNVDWSDFRVIFVQDGFYEKWNWEKVAMLINESTIGDSPQYSISYTTTSITKGRNGRGPSIARNLGMDRADANFVMFCDCDDMFANVYSLYNILNVCDTDDFDTLNGQFYAERGPTQWGVTDMTEMPPNYISVQWPGSIYNHCKLYRLDFLRKSGLRFQEDMHFAEDVTFNLQVNLRVPEGRNGNITSDSPLYVWTHRPGSLSASKDVWVKDLYSIPKKAYYILPDFKRYRSRREYLDKVVTVFFEMYYHPSRFGEERFDCHAADIYEKYGDDFKAAPFDMKHDIETASRRSAGKEVTDKLDSTYHDIYGWFKDLEEILNARKDWGAECKRSANPNESLQADL